jgi:hypothetical protein
VDHLAGLDLGQAAQYTALAIVERTRIPDPDKPFQTTRSYAVRHLQRWPLKTAYEDIANDVAGLLGQLPLHRPLLAVDQTGVGQTVVGLVRRAGIPASVFPVTVTFGSAVAPPGRMAPRTSPSGTWPACWNCSCRPTGCALPPCRSASSWHRSCASSA